MRVILFAFILLITGSSTCWAQKSTTGDVTDVVTIDTLDPAGPYNKIWQPFIAKWSDDHFVAAYGLQVRRKVDMGDIVCSITRDGGKTWSPPIMVFDHRVRNGTVQYAYNNSVLYRPPGQDVIWLFVMRAPMHYRDSENADLVAAYTADGGYSWHHVELAMDYQSPLIIVGSIHAVERDGITHYLLPAHRNTGRRDPFGDRRQFVLESKSLIHWKLGAYIEYPENDPVFLHEGAIGPGENAGELKIMMRTADMIHERPIDPPVAYSSVSKDDGKTWSVAKPELKLPNHRSKCFYGRDSNERDVYVYSEDWDRRGLRYKTRIVGGDWSDAKRFYRDNNRNSYPTLLEDEPGEWLSVWDSSDSPDLKRTAIRFGRFKPVP